MLASELSMSADAYRMIDHSNEPKPLVLIVENQSGSRSTLKKLLDLWGCHVPEDENGEDSIDAAISGCANLIFRDTSLSEMDGLTTMRRMREIEALRNVPIVLISGHAEPERCKFALTVGGNDFLLKPINFNQLETILKKFRANKFINSGGFTV